MAYVSKQLLEMLLGVESITLFVFIFQEDIVWYIFIIILIDRFIFMAYVSN